MQKVLAVQDGYIFAGMHILPDQAAQRQMLSLINNTQKQHAIRVI